MTEILKIDGNRYTAEDLLTYLKLNNQYDEVLDSFVRHKVSVLAAKKKGVEIAVDELQQGADDFRRLLGLHRAKETMDWLESQNLSLENVEQFLEEQLCKKKVIDDITADDKIEEYFKLNSPQFDEVTLKSIIVDSKEKANELIASLEDDPSDFASFVTEHTLDDDTKNTGGLLPSVRRGTLPDEIEAKVFNSVVGALVGPFQLDGEELYQILLVVEVKSANLSDFVKSEIGETLFEEWQDERLNDFQISAD